MNRIQSAPELHSYIYDERFFRYVSEGAARSARLVVARVLEHLKVTSVVDVGCGAGAWICEYRKAGVSTCLGVDGSYVSASSLLIPPSAFVAFDIVKPFDLGRSFDLVQCLEVAEHVPSGASRTLVQNLVRHGDVVLFSAATPGQGGENHINEQPYQFWRALFAEHGYSPYDFLRPLIHGNRSVEPWYRHNTMLYVADRSRAALPPSVAATRVPDQQPIADLASIPYRLRTRILANLSVQSLSRLAILKHRWVIFTRSLSRPRAVPRDRP